MIDLGTCLSIIKNVNKKHPIRAVAFIIKHIIEHSKTFGIIFLTIGIFDFVS